MLGRNSSKLKPKEDIEVLLKRIDEQNEQINRLQTKFRDVTHAYKSLLNEKKALEIIVKSIDTKNQSNSQSKPKSSGLTSRSVSNSDISEIDYQTNENAESTEQEKIQALTANIQLLVDTKAKLELNYQAEKKKLRSDYEELKQKFDSFKLEAEKINENYEIRLKETKTSLKQSQFEREKLTSELNSMIKIKNSEQENKILNAQDETQSLLFNLRNENVDLKQKIKNLTKQFENKCEELIQTNSELKQLKLAHNEQINEDETDLIDLRKQLKESNESNERRVSELEARISDLCMTIAQYESNSNQSHSYNSIEPNNQFKTSKIICDNTIDFDSAIEQFIQLKKFIETTAKESKINFDFNEIWRQNDELNLKIEKQKLENYETENEKLKSEIKNLKDEFEKYKIRTNYLLKSSVKQNQSQTISTNNNQELKDEIEVLKKRIILIEKDHEEEIEDLKKSNQSEIEKIRNNFKSQIDKVESERLLQISQIEKELVNQRERTIKLLGEKETEIDLLKKDKDSNSFLNNTDSDSDSTTNRLIYVAEANAYKESELIRLRQAKAELEYKLKQTFDENCVDIDRLECQIKILKEEIERLKLNQSRNDLNGHNLEYIKNVVYSYLTTKDSNVKLSMIHAIMQILKFTKNEKQKIGQLIKNSAI